jgi:transcriptional regulator with XRE-family HTH domain
MSKKRTRNFGDYLRAKLAADPTLATAVEEESFNADIAQQVYDLRIGAGLSQKQLAAMIGTHQSVISRIEDADYDGHSLSLLKKIATGLKRRLRIEFVAQVHPVVKEEIAFLPTWTSLLSWKNELVCTHTSRDVLDSSTPDAIVSSRIAGAV